MEADRIHIPLQTDIPSLGLEQQLLAQRAANEGGFRCSTSAPLRSTSIPTSYGNSRPLNRGSVGAGGGGYAARSKGREGLDLPTCGASALETFMMLRSGAAGYKRRASVRLAEEEPERKKKGSQHDKFPLDKSLTHLLLYMYTVAAAVHSNGQRAAAEPLESEEGGPETTVTSPTIQDVYLSGTETT